MFGARARSGSLRRFDSSFTLPGAVGPGDVAVCTCAQKGGRTRSQHGLEADGARGSAGTAPVRFDF